MRLHYLQAMGITAWRERSKPRVMFHWVELRKQGVCLATWLFPAMAENLDASEQQLLNNIAMAFDGEAHWLGVTENNSDVNARMFEFSLKALLQQSSIKAEFWRQVNPD